MKNKLNCYKTKSLLMHSLAILNSNKYYLTGSITNKYNLKSNFNYF